MRWRREYTLLVVFPILRVDSDDKGTGYTAGALTVARVSWDGTDKPCDVSGVSNFAVAVEYSLVVILYILRVDRDDKGTGYAADFLTVTRASGGL